MFQRWPPRHSAEQILASPPVGRLLRAEELCATVRFMCLSDVRFMTGTTLVLDGGYTALWAGLSVSRKLLLLLLLLADACRYGPLKLPLEDQVNDQHRYDGDDHGRKECPEVD